jgi:twitching motility protein PilT
VRFRVAGRISPDGDAPLDAEAAERMVLSMLDPAQREMLAARGELDFCQTFAGIGRFRANLYRGLRGLDGVFRFISATPPTLEQLGLPARLAKFTTYHQGMVVITGPSGCGKSSTMAALVNLINEERREHILTIEDPIEYVHTSKRCLVNQRSAGNHTQSFARALRAALREDPDVIVIGELRDLETVSLALSAAETGHFVLATLHTDNAIRTVNRLVGSFPADQQDQVRTMLSESLRAVISQRLLPRADGRGRAVALETMVVTRAVANLIRENKTFQIHSILQTGSSQGMALLDQSIRELVSKGEVKAEVAARFVEDAKAAAA